VDVDLGAQPLERLPRDVEVTAYFVIAQALTNVVKHAHATRARIAVASAPEELAVEVTDDGIGGADPGGGSGLTGLSDRVDSLDGQLTLTSTPDSGTTVRIVLPVPDTRPG
jgi:signal transduction histidine kinase